jgi:hypothetical protein
MRMDQRLFTRSPAMTSKYASVTRTGCLSFEILVQREMRPASEQSSSVFKRLVHRPNC